MSLSSLGVMKIWGKRSFRRSASRPSFGKQRVGTSVSTAPDHAHRTAV